MARIDRRINAARPADTPADVAARRQRNVVLQRVRTEREARYPSITAENVDEVLAWQESRISALEFEAHQAADPHCTCNDCMSDYEERLS